MTEFPSEVTVKAQRRGCLGSGMLMAAALITMSPLFFTRGSAPLQASPPDRIDLPRPIKAGRVSVEESLEKRRSRRSFSSKPVTLQEVSQLLWSAQGVTHPEGRRTAPSAGALYPLEAFLVAGNVADLPAGVYRYRPQGHDLVQVKSGDLRPELSAAARGQEWVRRAPASIVLAGVIQRTAKKYGSRAERYVHMEVGAAAENVCLQAVAIDLATVLVGAFHDSAVKRLLGMESDEKPLALLPFGKPAF
jgi:SagB-type dehydrogenase family enzyme